jgi:hypothetical protein
MFSRLLTRVVNALRIRLEISKRLQTLAIRDTDIRGFGSEPERAGATQIVAAIKVSSCKG